MIVTASTLDADTVHDTDELQRKMKGNLCRCTGYRAIRQAIRQGVDTARPADPPAGRADASNASPAGRADARTASPAGRADARDERRVETTSPAIGTSLTPPAGRRVVTGTEPYTFDVAVPGTRYLRVLTSPHPHARIVSIDTSAAQSLPGVALILTHENVSTRRFSTAKHESRADDPDDTLVLDSVVRFVGQRVAAVVADTAGIAEEACRLIVVEYEPLPGVFDPEEARRPGAPLVHPERTPEDRVFEAERNVISSFHELSLIHISEPTRPY